MIVVEPMRRQECNFINTVVEGTAIVGKVNHPNVHLLFDVYHMLQNGEDQTTCARWVDCSGMATSPKKDTLASGNHGR